MIDFFKAKPSKPGQASIISIDQYGRLWEYKNRSWRLYEYRTGFKYTVARKLRALADWIDQ